MQAALDEPLARDRNRRERHIERFPFSAWVHVGVAAAEAARRAAADGARTPAPGAICRPCRPMPHHNAQESSDRAACTAGQAAVSDCASLAHPRRKKPCFVSRDSCFVKTEKAAARAALPSPPDLFPTGADGVFVPNNDVITFNLNQPPTEKKTEGLQYQEATIRHS